MWAFKRRKFLGSLKISIRTGPVIQRHELRGARRRWCLAVWSRSLRLDLQRASFFELITS